MAQRLAPNVKNASMRSKYPATNRNPLRLRPPRFLAKSTLPGTKNMAAIRRPGCNLPREVKVCHLRARLMRTPKETAAQRNQPRVQRFRSPIRSSAFWVSGSRICSPSAFYPQHSLRSERNVSCRNQAFSQVCAFPSSFFVAMSEIGIFRELCPREIKSPAHWPDQ
jgi:hypothetical protein